VRHVSKPATRLSVRAFRQCVAPCRADAGRPALVVAIGSAHGSALGVAPGLGPGVTLGVTPGSAGASGAAR
jgi:hypothetical protein